jgi:hypothetical protein
MSASPRRADPEAERSLALAVPAGASALLGLLAWWPQIHGDPSAFRTFLGAAGVLAAATVAVRVGRWRGAPPLELRFAARRPHWVQALAQLGVFVYWGWYVRTVYDFAPYLLAQLAFAYGVDALVNLHRRSGYVLGFGPIPIVFSINLFLWFKPEWFYWQFGMIALGYLAKEFIRWEREGRSAHIFNPSSFPLAVASLILILTETTHVTFGLQIANTQAIPPHMYAVIFLVAVPGQILFGVATMTAAAVVSAVLFSQAHLAITGTLFFDGTYIPAAVFLGMHLLFTDPSTAPRTAPGRVLFGVLYGLGTIAVASVLLSAGAPGFYDKLLIVPILNLCVRRIDRWTSARRALPRVALGPASVPLRRNVVTVCGWTVLFVGMAAAGTF